MATKRRSKKKDDRVIMTTVMTSSFDGYTVFPTMRKFDADGKPSPRSGEHRLRYIYVDIRTYRGFSPGATHFYLSITEEDNPCLATREATGEQVWLAMYKDPLSHGIDFNARFDTMSEAQRMARTILSERGITPENRLVSHNSSHLFDDDVKKTDTSWCWPEASVSRQEIVRIEKEYPREHPGD